jgi:hypothetical protein
MLMLFYAHPHIPLCLDPSSSLMLHRMDGGNILLHVFPPPPNFYQSSQVYWGNPYALADSDNDSNHSDNVPVDVGVRAAAIYVSTSVANVSNVVACVSAASVDVSAAALDICPLDAALANVSAPVVDASAYFVNTSNLAVNMSADVDVANINFVPAALNHATSPFDNIMSDSRRKSTGRSVEPSNVTGIDKQHKMWIQQVMIDD